MNEIFEIFLISYKVRFYFDYVSSENNVLIACVNIWGIHILASGRQKAKGLRKEKF